MKWRVFLTTLVLLGGSLAPAAEKPAKSTANHIVYLEDSRPVLIRVHVEIDGKPLHVAWEDFLDGLFKDADADKNGTLDATEVARLPALETLFPNTRFRLAVADVALPGRGNTLAAMDGNKDGKVSRDELAAYFRASNATPFQLQFGGQDPFEQRRLIARGGGGAMPSADTLNDALFKVLDADKDGKLSRSELLDAPALLSKLDADDDEVLTAQEVVQQPPPSGYEQVLFFDGMPQQPANNPFVAVRPGEPAAALARQILARYAKGDKAKAKKLGRDDLKLDDKAFTALDADEDGELDAEELARFASREPDVEIVLRLGKTRKPAREIVSPAAKEPPGPHDPVNVEVGNTRLNLRVTLPNSGPTAPATPADRFKAQFTAADTDGNGYLEMKEVEGNRFFATQFKSMDADNDGKIFLKEMLAFFERQQSVQKRAMASCVTVTASDQGKGVLDQAGSAFASCGRWSTC
jgi:Ca2+-binding EF-hand superfamily protein